AAVTTARGLPHGYCAGSMELRALEESAYTSMRSPATMNRQTGLAPRGPSIRRLQFKAPDFRACVALDRHDPVTARHVHHAVGDERNGSRVGVERIAPRFAQAVHVLDAVGFVARVKSGCANIGPVFLIEAADKMTHAGEFVSRTEASSPAPARPRR